MWIDSLCHAHVRRPGPDVVSGCRAAPARWPGGARSVTTQAAEHGAVVLRAKGKDGGGKVESSAASDTLTSVAHWEKRAKEDTPTGRESVVVNWPQMILKLGRQRRRVRKHAACFSIECRQGRLTGVRCGVSARGRIAPRGHEGVPKKHSGRTFVNGGNQPRGCTGHCPTFRRVVRRSAPVDARRWVTSESLLRIFSPCAPRQGEGRPHRRKRMVRFHK